MEEIEPVARKSLQISRFQQEGAIVALVVLVIVCIVGFVLLNRDRPSTGLSVPPHNWGDFFRCFLVPLSALRFYVIGEEAAERAVEGLAAWVKLGATRARLIATPAARGRCELV